MAPGSGQRVRAAMSAVAGAVAREEGRAAPDGGGGNRSLVVAARRPRGLLWGAPDAAPSIHAPAPPPAEGGARAPAIAREPERRREPPPQRGPGGPVPAAVPVRARPLHPGHPGVSRGVHWLSR